MDSTAVRQIWPELLRSVGERNKPAYALLQNATVKTVEGSTLVLAMPTAGLARQLGQESRAEVIKAALHDLVAGDWELRCVHEDAAPDGPGAARRPATATRTRPVAEARIAEPPPQRPPAPRPAEAEAPPPEPPPDPLDDVDMPPDPRDDDAVVPPEPERPKPDTVAVDLLTTQLRARRLP
jgi:DNA polymerase-3 subunit gamma/tau